jgi:putative acetyltransferase
LSLVAVSDDAVVGHVVFTICTVADGAGAVALLAPLAVLPGWQGQGVGSAIVGEGCRRMEEAGVDWVYVLGDPGYYGRFEFAADDGVDPPYPLPAEWRAAWQSLGLGERAVPARGKLWVPQPWRQENLWSA